jgi:site-specific recombinase XerD
MPRDAREKAVIATWRASGLRVGTIAAYLGWIRRWRSHWLARGIDELRYLTLAGAIEFASTIIGRRHRHHLTAMCRASVRNGLHAWSCALQTLGVAVPCWRPSLPKRRLPPLLDEYAEYRRAHRGVAVGTMRRDVDIAVEFLAFLRSRERTIAAARIVDIDAFVDGMLDRLSRATVADQCSSLRGFLRFLRATGRVRHDLATAVVGPRVHVSARPPRALPWDDVRRILHAISRRDRREIRDYAILLLLASYGMGAAEVARLRLDDIDWTSKLLHVRRPKTGVPTELPLLPAVARALASYLRRGRPRCAAACAVFLTFSMPHRPITSAAVCHRVCKYARRVGIAVVGGHVFRHSHATRQIDLGADPKVVGDILGHRRPSSTSAYVRVALRRLRAIALPVPR